MRPPIANLDFLRAAAVMAVFGNHLLTAILRRRGAPDPAFFFSLGHVGVLAFFVHTSFVLMQSLERTGGSAIVFYTRRIFRIYPLNFICVVSACLFHIPAFPFETFIHHSALVVASNLLLLQNLVGRESILAPLWSLPYEMQMYIVLPALYWFSQKFQWRYVALLIVFFCGLGLWVKERTGHANMFEYIPCFLCGVLAYALRDSVRARIPALFWGPFLLLWFGAAAWPPASQAPIVLLGRAWIPCLILGVMIGFFRDSKNTAWNSGAAFVAKYSFGIYMTHVPVLWLMFQVIGIRNDLLASTASVVATLGLSILLFVFVEDPMIERGKVIAVNIWQRKISPVTESAPAKV